MTRSLQLDYCLVLSGDPPPFPPARARRLPHTTYPPTRQVVCLASTHSTHHGLPVVGEVPREHVHQGPLLTRPRTWEGKGEARAGAFRRQGGGRTGGAGPGRKEDSWRCITTKATTTRIGTPRARPCIISQMHASPTHRLRRNPGGWWTRPAVAARRAPYRNHRNRRPAHGFRCRTTPTACPAPRPWGRRGRSRSGGCACPNRCRHRCCCHCCCCCCLALPDHHPLIPCWPQARSR